MHSPLPLSQEMIGLYIADFAALTGKTPALPVLRIKRRLSGLTRNFKPHWLPLDR
ncbi:hypothetical protein P775_23320 [Puniceibacterium antarcticum]|uniref:Uncharacterized protein n=1 Tax=Puniceibacterium antarcticum TaxID=1206336 RepID=A0A2G8R995_9RHOB|nr:hypothetical protein P775_23320 [Puniceibacterium antarcticum]